MNSSLLDNSFINDDNINYEKVSYLFNKPFRMNIHINEPEIQDKYALFFIDENTVKYHNKWYKVYKKEWHFLSQIYWGDGLYSTLYFNNDGKLYVENSNSLLQVRK